MDRLDDRNIDTFFGTYERVTRWKKEKQMNNFGRKNRMSIQKDCFAYRIGRCTIMTEMICKRGNCTFFKTKEEMERDRNRYGFVKDYKPKGRCQ